MPGFLMMSLRMMSFLIETSTVETGQTYIDPLRTILEEFNQTLKPLRRPRKEEIPGCQNIAYILLDEQIGMVSVVAGQRDQDDPSVLLFPCDERSILSDSQPRTWV